MVVVRLSRLPLPADTAVETAPGSKSQYLDQITPEESRAEQGRTLVGRTAIAPQLPGPVGSWWSFGAHTMDDSARLGSKSGSFSTNTKTSEDRGARGSDRDPLGGRRRAGTGADRGI